MVERAAQGTRVQEMNAGLLRHRPEPGGNLPGLLHGAGTHLVRHSGGLDALPDGRGSNQQDVGHSAGTPAPYALGLFQQAAHPQADGIGVGAQALLRVVGAQHHDEQAHRLMAFQAGIQVRQGRQALLHRVVKDRGTAAKALLDDEVLLPQCLLQQAGPPLVLIEPGKAAVRAAGGVGAVAVGVGIAQADDVLLHRLTSRSPAGWQQPQTGPRGGTSRRAGPGGSFR